MQIATLPSAIAAILANDIARNEEQNQRPIARKYYLRTDRKLAWKNS
jgi:hypothetical protein